MEFIFKPILLAFDIGTDWWNGIGYLQLSNSSSELSQDEDKNRVDYWTAGLITICIPWLPGLFYAIVLGCFLSGNDTQTDPKAQPNSEGAAPEPNPTPKCIWKKLLVSLSTIPLAPIVPIVGSLMIAGNIIPKEYDGDKFKNFISLCCILESAMESSIQLCWQGIIAIKETDKSMVGTTTIVTLGQII